MNILRDYLFNTQSKIIRFNNDSTEFVFSSILAGFAISLGAALSWSASVNITDPLIQSIVRSAIFPIALILILGYKLELFTGNVLTILYIGKHFTIKNYITLLFMTLIGNIVGTFMAAFCFSLMDLILRITPTEAFTNLYVSKNTIESTPIEILKVIGESIMANIMVCTAVLYNSLNKSKISKLICTYVCVFIFVFAGFRHSIADSYYVVFSLDIFGSAASNIPLLQRLSDINYILILFEAFFNFIGGIILIFLTGILRMIIKNMNSKRD